MIHVGCAVDARVLRDDVSYALLVGRSGLFDSLTAENAFKWAPLCAKPNVWDFTEAEEIVSFAQRHRLRVKGHTLVWHNQMPAWIVPEMSADELREAVRRHVRVCVSFFRGRVCEWDVVNEVIGDSGDGRWRDSLLARKLGRQWVADVFRIAHDADPDAMLIYNDYSIAELGAKSDAVYAMLKEMLEQGVPVHAVGFQSHFDLRWSYDMEKISANIKRFGELGLKVLISELDVRVRCVDAVHLSDRLDIQAGFVSELMRTLARHDNVHAVTVWGVSDRHSWIHSRYGDDHPLPFDRFYRKKPFFDALIQLPRDDGVRPEDQKPDTDDVAVFRVEDDVLIRHVAAHSKCELGASFVYSTMQDGFVDIVVHGECALSATPPHYAALRVATNARGRTLTVHVWWPCAEISGGLFTYLVGNVHVCATGEDYNTYCFTPPVRLSIDSTGGTLKPHPALSDCPHGFAVAVRIEFRHSHVANIRGVVLLPCSAQDSAAMKE